MQPIPYSLNFSLAGFVRFGNTSQVHTVASIPLDENFTHFIDTTLRASPLARWRAVVGGPAVSTRGTRS